jgi:hypothetical protein
MYKRIAALWALTGLALALCLVGTAPALAQAQTDKVCETEDLTDQILTSPCLGSDITLTSGEITACVETVIDSEGRTHQIVTVHGQGQGVDDNGNKYVLVIVLPAHGSEIIDDGGAANASALLTLNLIGQDGAPDVKCHAVLHVTRNANGVFTVELEKIGEGCECADDV